MRPEKAAATLGSLEVDLAALLLSRLPERSSGKILAVMPPSTAAAIVKTMLEPPEPPGRKQLVEAGRNESEAETEGPSKSSSESPGESSSKSPSKAGEGTP